MKKDKENIKRKFLPPGWADRFLEWYCAPDLLEEVQGDLYEAFYRDLEKGSYRFAKNQFIRNVFLFFNYSTIRGSRSLSKVKNPTIMLGSYITLSFRNLLRYKFYSFLNLAGLAVGIAGFILIALYVLDEWSYDRFHDKADRIYRITVENFNQDGEKVRHWVSASPGFAPLLAEEYADIEEAVRLYLWDTPVLSVGDEKIIEENLIYAEASFFSIFTFPFIQGDPETALSEPNVFVLTENAARRYFGKDWQEQNLVGKEILYNGELPVKITGIIENVPSQSHLNFEVVGSFESVINYFGEEEVMEVVGNFNYPSFVLLNDGADVEFLNRQMFDFGKKYIPTIEGREYHKIFQIKLEPLVDIHLKSNTTTEYSNNGNINSIYIFGVSGLFILLVACINYMNLTTAKYTRRMKEVGIRKVMGAYRYQVIQQFLMEALFYAFLSLLFALGIVWLLLPYLNDFVDKSLGQDLLNLRYILYLILILAGVGFISGSYPAFYLSRFLPARILRGTPKSSGYTSLPRSTLVIFQFVISIVLIICVGVVSDQMEYIRSKNLGYSREQILSFRTNSYMREHWEAVKTEFSGIPGVKKVTASSRIPTGQLMDSFAGYVIREDEPMPIDFRLAMIRIDPSFFDTYDINLKAGRNFREASISDTLGAYILNEMAIRRLGWDDPAEAIDQPFRYGNQEGRIIGVVADFHFESLHTPIAPIIFFQYPSSYYRASLKIDLDYFEDIISILEKKWRELEPEYPFTYQFVDEAFEERYASEKRLGILFKVFSGMALFIGCLGLLGLVGFVTEYRAKEISIRKVMGATMGHILQLISGQFVKLILIALLIAIPLAWYFMDQWLHRFAYHTSISGFTILGAGVLIISITFFTISFVALKAAIKNPVDQLRSE